MTESQNVQVPPALSESNSDLFHHSYEERGTKLDNNIFGQYTYFQRNKTFDDIIKLIESM